MLCQECPNKPLCKRLCPEAEFYVNQDNPNYHKEGDLHFTPIEKKILTLLMKGKTKDQIRETLKLSVHGLNVHIGNLKKKSQDIVL
jgi:DNA-binding NarL/FixJ family response regulator